jgi:hypothetical protein
MSKKKNQKTPYLRRIPGYSSKYLVSRDGYIYKETKYGFFELKPSQVHNGYLTISIPREGTCVKHRTKIHRLVALAFIPNPNQCDLVIHLNNDPTDNRVENLKWGTQGENMQQMVKDGRQRKSKFLLKYLDRILKLRDQGFSPSEISRILDISKTSTYRAIKKSSNL